MNLKEAVYGVVILFAFAMFVAIGVNQAWELAIKIKTAFGL